MSEYPFGPDTSIWQGHDIRALLVGAQFAISKATQGITIVDPAHADQLRQAKAASNIVGTIAYHYGDLSNPEAQADFFIQHALDADMLALDYEETLTANGGHPDYARRFLARVHRIDPRLVGLYGADLNNWPGDVGQDWNWVARIGGLPSHVWSFHQFTWTAIAGTRRFDGNHFHGTSAQLAAFFSKPIPKPLPVLGGDALTNLFPHTVLSYVVDLPKGAVLTRTPGGARYTQLAEAATLPLLGATGTAFHVADGDYGVYVPREGLAPRRVDPPVTVGK